MNNRSTNLCGLFDRNQDTATAVSQNDHKQPYKVRATILLTV